MPVAPVDQQHPANPVFLVMDAVAVPGPGSATSDAVDCQGFEHASLYLAPAGNVTAQTFISLDEVTWFLLVPQNDTPGPHSFAFASPTARRVQLAGARFIRLLVSNGTAAPVAVSAHVALA